MLEDELNEIIQENCVPALSISQKGEVSVVTGFRAQLEEFLEFGRFKRHFSSKSASPINAHLI